MFGRTDRQFVLADVRPSNRDDARQIRHYEKRRVEFRCRGIYLYSDRERSNFNSDSMVSRFRFSLEPRRNKFGYYLLVIFKRYAFTHAVNDSSRHGNQPRFLGLYFSEPPTNTRRRPSCAFALKHGGCQSARETS